MIAVRPESESKPGLTSAFAIANYFLAKAWSEGETITPLKLQKLVYFAHGWFMALENRPLIKEPVMAWRYGPVIPPLYFEFRRFENNPITSLATEPDANFDFVPVLLTPELRDEVSPVLDRVWDVYGKYSASQLSQMTHHKDTPWSEVRDESVTRGTGERLIPNDQIREYFRGRS